MTDKFSICDLNALRSEECVTMLREVLAEAEVGKILSLCIVAETAAGDLRYFKTRLKDRYAMGGKLLAAAADVVKIQQGDG